MLTFFPLQPQKDFSSPWLYLSDQNGLPTSGEITFSATGVHCQSQAQQFALNLLYPIPGFGEVMVKTQIVADQNQSLCLEESLLQAQAEQIGTIANQGEKQQVQSILAKGLAAIVDQNAEVVGECLAKLFFLGEEIALQQARRKIDPSHQLVLGGQGFRALEQPDLRDFIQTNFDQVVLPIYFFETQPEAQTMDLAKLKKLLALFSDTDLIIKAHPLLWFHPKATPAWILELPLPELKKMLQQRINTLMQLFGDRVTTIDLVNEFHSADANGLGLDISSLVELVDFAAKEVRRHNPNIKRILNFSEVFGAGSAIGDNPNVPMEHFLDLCAQRGIEYEGIGFQFYTGLKREFSCREMLDISLFFDRFERLDKELHLTELGFPSKFAVDPESFFSNDHPAAGGWWHQPWNETTQAEYLDNLITIFKSKPGATSVTWWDLTDQGFSQDIGSKFFPFAGLLRRDLSPKPAVKIWRKQRHNQGEK